MRIARGARARRGWTKPWPGASSALCPGPWSKALNFSSGGNVYCVRTDGPGVALRGAKVTLLHFMDGSLGVRYKDRVLATTLFKTRPRPGPLEDEKTIDLRMAAIVAAARTHAQLYSPQGRG